MLFYILLPPLFSQVEEVPRVTLKTQQPAAGTEVMEPAAILSSCLSICTFVHTSSQLASHRFAISFAVASAPLHICLSLACFRHFAFVMPIPMGCHCPQVACTPILNSTIFYSKLLCSLILITITSVTLMMHAIAMLTMVAVGVVHDAVPN